MKTDTLFKHISETMKKESDQIREQYDHKSSSGHNREEIVRNFLRRYLPERFGISTGTVISAKGERSNQCDIIIFDKQNSVSLYPAEHPNKLWPVESVYAVIEVKAVLNQASLKKSIDDCEKLKKLEKTFPDFKKPSSCSLKDNILYVLWSFEHTWKTDNLAEKQRIIEKLKKTETKYHPDFILVLEQLLIQSGYFHELVGRWYQGNPEQIQMLGELKEKFTSPNPIYYDSKEYTLMMWYIFFNGWLRNTGDRVHDLVNYIPQDKTYGMMYSLFDLYTT